MEKKVSEMTNEEILRHQLELLTELIPCDADEALAITEAMVLICDSLRC